MISVSNAARLQYGEARARDLSFMAVLALWRKRRAGGMTQSQFAENLGRDTGWLSKKLKGPSNWTLKTLGHMVEALGGELEIVVHDLSESPDRPRNYDAYSVAAADESLQSGVIGNSMEATAQGDQPGAISNAERSA
jgi:transcriptional regulator with XRE-family HTH domain